MILPVYIAEMSPKKSRGKLCSIIGPGYNIGILLGAACNIGFARFRLGWRIANGVQAVLAVVYTAMVVFIPHTPRYACMCNLNCMDPSSSYRSLHKVVIISGRAIARVHNGEKSMH